MLGRRPTKPRTISAGDWAPPVRSVGSGSKHNRRVHLPGVDADDGMMHGVRHSVFALCNNQRAQVEQAALFG